jgi:hypothetical protein
LLFICFVLFVREPHHRNKREERREPENQYNNSEKRSPEKQEDNTTSKGSASLAILEA